MKKNTYNFKRQPPIKIELERCSAEEFKNHKFNKRNIEIVNKEIKDIRFYTGIPNHWFHDQVHIRLNDGTININLVEKTYRYEETVGAGV